VTVKLDEPEWSERAKYFNGKVVSQSEPFMKEGTYWGYQVRVAHSINEVFDECPFEGGYDLKIGDSHKGEDLSKVEFSEHKDFEHALIFFGGLEGIEGIVEEMEDNLKKSDVRDLFDMYINSCPERGCRTTSVRTEESVLISLGALMPQMRQNGLKNIIKGKKERLNKKKSDVKSTML